MRFRPDSKRKVASKKYWSFTLLRSDQTLKYDTWEDKPVGGRFMRADAREHRQTESQGRKRLALVITCSIRP
jgi:hypothetical protein